MRKAGILMPISSLPSPYGIGTMGSEARKFVDFLARGGQSCWQGRQATRSWKCQFSSQWQCLEGAFLWVRTLS